MSSVDRALESIARVHAVLALASLAVLLLASPTGPDFRSGLVQLQQLGDLLGKEGYTRRCREIAGRAYLGIWSAARAFDGPQRRADIPAEALFGAVARCPVPFDASLEAIAEFLGDRERVETTTFDPTELHAALVRSETGGEPILGVWVTISGFGSFGWSNENEVAVGGERLHVAVNDAAWDSVTPGDDLLLYVRRGSGISPVPLEGGVISRTLGSTPLEWASHAGTGFAALADSTSGLAVALPGLRPFWPEIREFSMSEATRYLQARADQQQGSVEVLGMTIAATFIVWGGPLLLLALLGHMFVHLRHLERIVGTDRASLRVYPWIGLFPEASSLLLWLMSIVALPTAACVAVAIRSWSDSAYVAGWGITAAATCLSLGLAIARVTKRLRS